MKTFCLVLTLVALTYSCSNNLPKWARVGFDEKHFKYSKLELTESKINDLPFYSTRDNFIEEFGKPIDSVQFYAQTWKQIENRTDSILATQLMLKNVQLLSALGKTKVVFVDLFHSNYRIETQEFGILTNETTLVSIKKKAKNSYEMRNQPVELSNCEFPPITGFDIQKGRVTWLKFTGSKKGSCDDLEMIFFKEKLAFVTLTGIDLKTECF